MTGSTISLQGRSRIEISKPRKGRVLHAEPEPRALFTKQKNDSEQSDNLHKSRNEVKGV